MEKFSECYEIYSTNLQELIKLVPDLFNIGKKIVGCEFQMRPFSALMR
jgi:hypothetical protein